MNSGKRFEQNVKDSIPTDTYIYRFKDGSASWGGNDKVRFQSKNICDFMIYKKPYLFLLELKSTKGKSLPLSNIKKHQIDDLLDADKYDGIVCGFLIEFSEHNTVYFIEISRFQRFLEETQRKSLPIDYLAENGVKIDIQKKKVNIKLNIEKMIKDIINESNNKGLN